VTADEAYLRESILNPGARIVAGYDKSETAMPSYEGLLNASQVDSLILYLKSLK
jgi:cytochrome c oxidase subunit 2